MQQPIGNEVERPSFTGSRGSTWYDAANEPSAVPTATPLHLKIPEPVDAGEGFVVHVLVWLTGATFVYNVESTAAERWMLLRELR